jgi:hypothetical protein
VKPAILAALAAASVCACTELDALTGSRPDLPWSPLAPRGPVSLAAGDLYDARTSVVNGALRLQTDLPRAAADCLARQPAALCADRDGDGLADEWEDLALDRFRPFVRVDDGDPIHIDADGRVGSVGRVAPAEDQAGEPRIRLFLVLGYSRDYGRCTFGGHFGDSERVALDLAPVGDEPGAVELVGAYTAAHEGTGNDAGRVFRRDDLATLEYDRDPVTGEARWVVYASRSKHATYATPGLCEANDSWLFCGDEDCASGRSIDPPNELLMPVVNAGEPAAHLVERFMDEPVWDEVRFCGGLGHGIAPCASPLVEKMSIDPFRDEG